MLSSMRPRILSGIKTSLFKILISGARHFSPAYPFNLGNIPPKNGRNILERAFYANDNKPVLSPLKSTVQSNQAPIQKPSRNEIFLFCAFLALAFLFRLAFGLCSEIWFIDQQQIYLIGLKYYATGLWPYFGPDVAENIQLPGALQGLVIGLPLKVWPIPESPYVFLNLLSFAGLCFLAWYTC